VARDDHPWLNEVHRSDSVCRPHRESITNRKNGDVDLALEELHVHEEAGVSRQVKSLTAVQFKEEAGRDCREGLSPRKLDHPAVDGGRHLHVPERVVDATTNVLGANIDPVILQVRRDLVRGDDRRARVFRQRNQVTDMISVSVCYENEVCLDIVS
jgi:hypothetical protein